MGVLDEAIRQHLDLKRRRGADPAEIERAEQEALGPVRRGPEPLGADALEQEGLPYDVQSEEDWDEPFDEELEDEPFAEEEPFAEDEALPPRHGAPAARAPEEPRPFAEEDPFADEDPFEGEDDPVGPPPHQAPGPPPFTSTGGETVEYRVPEAAEAGKGEDVLEETPEFLQDTPDHDRLWFEQRPPRDFDFDG